MKYDCIIVLASKPDIRTWKFPSHIYASLDKAAELLQAGAAPYIAVSGKWALHFDALGIQQPFRECDVMADYLVKLGVPTQQILREGTSKDTIANLFYLKRTIFEPQNLRRLLFVTTSFRTERLRYLAGKILGPGYTAQYQTVPVNPRDINPKEASILALTRDYLGEMTPGDDAFLEGSFYSAEYYVKVGAR